MNNSKKNNNGWILCPSKTFPGKFYYFNVLNGEAAWSLNDSEKKLMKKEHINKVNHKHSYPEPDSPPEESPDTSNSMLHGHQFTPMFGQAVFPQYISNQKYPNIWPNKPIQPTVTIVNEKKKTLDQNTQTWEPERELFVQSSGVPLSYRFVNHNQFNENPLNCKENPFKNTENSLSFNNQLLKFNQNTVKFNENSLKYYENPQSFNKSPLKFNENSIKFNNKQLKINQNPMNLYKSPSKINQNPFNVNETLVRFNEKQKFNENLLQFNNDIPKFNENHLKYKENSLIFNEYKYPNHTSTPKKNCQLNKTCFRNKFDDIQAKDYETNTYQSLFRPKTDHQSTPIIKEPVLNKMYQKLNRNTSKSFDDLSIINENPNKLTPQTMNAWKSFEDLSTVDDFVNPTVCQRNKVQNRCAERNNIDTLKTLDSGDLRFLLELKKRQKSVEDLHKGLEGKKTKSQDALKVNPTAKVTTIPSKAKITTIPTKVTTIPAKVTTIPAKVTTIPKKHVTFDITDTSNEDTDTVCEEEYEANMDLSSSLDISILRNLAKPAMNRDHWYIVVDTSVLLEDYNFIDNYVQTDSNCRLFIPGVVRHEMEVYCRDADEAVAERVASRLRTPHKHVTVQSSEYNKYASETEAILNCCLQIAENNYHVVLITGCTILHTKAKTIGLNCYTLNEIKHKPNQYSDLKKIKIILQNEKNENIFLQPPLEYIPYGLDGKDCIAVDAYKKRLFERQEVKLLKDTGTSPIHIEEEIKPKIIRQNKKYPFYYETDDTGTATEIGCNIRNLNLKEDLNQKEKHIQKEKRSDFKCQFDVHNRAKVNLAIDKNYTANVLKNGLNLEDKLKMFYIKDKGMEDRILFRMEEWICVFTQLMEEILSEVIQRYTSPDLNSSPPWTLHEVVDCINNAYGDHPVVNAVIDKFNNLLYGCTFKMGKLSNNMRPGDLMQIIGCGALLIQALKDILPQSEELSEGEGLIAELLNNLQEQELVFDTPVVHTPVLGAKETHMRADRTNFIKKPSDILPYLKKHYPAWEAFDENLLNKNFNTVLEKPKEVKIVRTCGKELYNLKIDNNKNMTMTKSENNIFDQEKEKLKILPQINDLNVPIHSNTFNDSNDKNNEPKVIRNIKIIDAFEEKLKLKTSLDLNALDYELYESLSTTDNFSQQTMINDENEEFNANVTEDIVKENKNDVSENQKNDKNCINNEKSSNGSIVCLNDVFETKNDGHENNDKNESLINEFSNHLSTDLTNDSGFENDSVHAYILAKTFLTELSSTFKAIYNFIDVSINEYKVNESQEEKKRLFQEKASRTQIHITEIIDKLKSIVTREYSDETALKILLMNAGAEAAADKRIIRYRQVVTKCLEQAQMLQSVLKTMLSISYDETDDVQTPNVRYFNIFE